MVPITKIIPWFLANQRTLPWRENPSPYAVWVSEIMLQQTRVAVVIPYFLRWMERFPSIQALADASVESVLKEWEGLGYYSRARNLHAGARYVVDHYGGNLPIDEDMLGEIKGLGAYTVGAIRSFAFKQRAPAVDGNVIRVLSRYFAVEGDVGKKETQNTIQKHALDVLPEDRSWIVSEALIELGATLCGKKPRCGECPLQGECQGYRDGIAERLPVKEKKEKSIELFRGVALVECEGHFLLRRGEEGKIMADLYEFPYFSLKAKEFSLGDCVDRLSMLGLQKKSIQSMQIVRHTFTKYRATLIPYHVVVDGMPAVPECSWVSFDQVRGLPFSSGHRRLLKAFELVDSESLCQ